VDGYEEVVYWMVWWMDYHSPAVQIPPSPTSHTIPSSLLILPSIHTVHCFQYSYMLYHVRVHTLYSVSI